MGKPHRANRRRPKPVYPSRPIVLVGMMGVGKTSVGRKLASRLRMKFIDADEEIETAAGMPISEIFARFGEEYFRDGERRVIARLIQDKSKVIATGGGAFINDETRNLILNNAISIWLNADMDILVERVSRRSHRPLLIGKDPRQVLTELGEERNPFYEMADIHISSDKAPVAVTVGAIVKSLSSLSFDKRSDMKA